MYKGYVDDPRNTDNAWMETVAVNFHDESGKNSILMKRLYKYIVLPHVFDLVFFRLGNSVSELPLQAGDDAGQVSWIDVDSSLDLYANHVHFLETVAKERNTHW